MKQSTTEIIETLFNQFADEHEEWALTPGDETLVKKAMTRAFREGQLSKMFADYELPTQVNVTGPNFGTINM